MPSTSIEAEIGLGSGVTQATRILKQKSRNESNDVNDAGALTHVSFLSGKEANALCQIGRAEKRSQQD